MLRTINAGLVLDTLRGSEALRVTDIVGRTELSRPTVDAALEDLVRLGLVREVVARAGDDVRHLFPRRGRPARAYAFRADAGHVLGVDIGPGHVHAVVADLRGDRVGEHSSSHGRDLGRADRLHQVYGTIDTALRRSRLGPGALRAAGVGTPGTVDTTAGRVRSCSTVAEWSDLPLAGLLRDLLGCPVVVENDAHLAAIAEWWRGAAQGMHDLVFFFSGEDAGLGIVLEDRLIRGHRGGAGDLGPVRPGASTSDPTSTLARLVVATSLLLAPELIVVGDRRGDDAPVAPLQRAAQSLVEPMAATLPAIRPSALGPAVVALGAVHRALEYVGEHLLDDLGR